MKIYKIAFFSILSTIFLSSCFSPQPLIQVQPNSSENIFWHDGQPIAESKQDSIITRAAFSHISDQYYIFDVEIFNESKQPFLVSPEDMFIVIHNNLTLPAMDPEKIIFSMKMETSRIEARRKNTAIAAGVLVIGTAIAIAVTDGDSDDYDDYNNYDDYNVVSELLLPSIFWSIDFREQAILSTKISTIPLDSKLDFWTGAALRKTTLRKGESIRGLVAFPRHSATNLLLTIPLSNVKFEFLFNQKQYQP